MLERATGVEPATPQLGKIMLLRSVQERRLFAAVLRTLQYTWKLTSLQALPNGPMFFLMCASRRHTWKAQKIMARRLMRTPGRYWSLRCHHLRMLDEGGADFDQIFASFVAVRRVAGRCYMPGAPQ